MPNLTETDSDGKQWVLTNGLRLQQKGDYLVLQQLWLGNVKVIGSEPDGKWVDVPIILEDALNKRIKGIRVVRENESEVKQ